MNYKKIEAAEAAADELWRNTYEPDEKAAPEETKVDTPAPEKEVAKPEDKPLEEKPEGEKLEEPAPPIKDEGKQDVTPEKTADWQQKYKTLEGKYRAEVPRLAEDLKHWKQNAVQLSEKIAELEKNVFETNSNTQRTEIDGDIENLVAEYPQIGNVIKKINQQHASEVKTLRETYENKLNLSLAPVKEGIQETREAKFDADMARFGVPNWREIDSNQEFIEYLANSAVPYSRKSKLELLREAGQVMDAEVASKFFLEFTKATEPSEKPVDGQDKLKKYVAPPKNEVGTNPKGGSKMELTVAMYEKFYKETSRPGRYNPKNWFGKSEVEMEALLEGAVQRGELKR